jgi:hypothetical protein
MRNWPLIRFALYETFFDNIIKLVAKNHIFIHYIYIKNSYQSNLCLQLYPAKYIDEVILCRLLLILFCIYDLILCLIISLDFLLSCLIEYSGCFEESIDQTWYLLIVYNKKNLKIIHKVDEKMVDINFFTKENKILFKLSLKGI